MPQGRTVSIGIALIAILVLAACGGDTTATPTNAQGPKLVSSSTNQPTATSMDDPTKAALPTVSPTSPPATQMWKVLAGA